MCGVATSDLLGGRTPAFQPALGLGLHEGRVSAKEIQRHQRQTAAAETLMLAPCRQQPIREGEGQCAARGELRWFESCGLIERRLRERGLPCGLRRLEVFVGLAFVVHFCSASPFALGVVWLLGFADPLEPSCRMFAQLASRATRPRTPRLSISLFRHRILCRVRFRLGSRSLPRRAMRSAGTELSPAAGGRRRVAGSIA